LFGRAALIVEDAVWMDRSARDSGWTQRAANETTPPSVYVVRSTVDLESTLRALAPFGASRVADRSEAEGLTRRLSDPKAVVVALEDRLRARAAIGKAAPAFSARVRGRSLRRVDDAALIHALQQLGATRIEFHDALDEAPLAEFASRLRPLLEGFDVGQDSPIRGHAVTRSIERLQR
jgi:hypothetical protein